MLTSAVCVLAMMGGGPPDAVPPALAEPLMVDGVRLAVPTPSQAAWHDLEVGMFIHMAPQTWQDSERDDGSTPLDAINPALLDTDQWADVALSVGAKYIVFVAKHEGGLCWWPTETTDYSVRSLPWRGGTGDVVADLAESCRERGLGLGLYLSPQDRRHGALIGGKTRDEAAQPEYEAMFRAQLTELLTRYGDIMEVWFDGSLVFDVGDIIAAHAPTAAVFQGPQATIRWVGNEDGFAPDPAWNAVNSSAATWGQYTGSHGDPSGDRWLPNECDARIRDTWFWRTDNEHTLKSLDALIDMYEKSVGRGGVLLLNATPDRRGLIPEADAARAAEFGAEIERRFGHASADIRGRGPELLVQPSAAVPVGYVIIQEDITQGERIRAYALDALVNGEWREIATGTSVGHKRIQAVSPVVAQAVRLRVTKSVGEPVIRRLAIYPPAAP